MVDTNSTHYLFLKRKVYYFSRHVPVDLREYYLTRRIVFSLRTKSKDLALKASKTISQRLEDYWMTLRLSNYHVPAQNLLKSNINVSSPAPLLSDALETYLRLKGINKGKSFHRGAQHNIEAVISLLGDRPIDEYSSSDAARFRDLSLERGLNTASVKRSFSYIRAVINLTISEQGIESKNAFAKTYIQDRDDVARRKPIPLKIISIIKKECRIIDDEKRWLIALIADTGMRLSEALGLHIDDIQLNSTLPYIDLKPHPWRPLKTKRSQRKIPIVGSALWATKRIIKECPSSYKMEQPSSYVPHQRLWNRLSYLPKGVF